jgi:hypothetical protein
MPMFVAVKWAGGQGEHDEGHLPTRQDEEMGDDQDPLPPPHLQTSTWPSGHGRGASATRTTRPSAPTIPTLHRDRTGLPRFAGRRLTRTAATGLVLVECAARHAPSDASRHSPASHPVQLVLVGSWTLRVQNERRGGLGPTERGRCTGRRACGGASADRWHPRWAGSRSSTRSRFCGASTRGSASSRFRRCSRQCSRGR